MGTPLLEQLRKRLEQRHQVIKDLDVIPVKRVFDRSKTKELKGLDAPAESFESYSINKAFSQSYLQ